MEKKHGRSPVKISVSPWKLTLPGKILTICICLLPFLTRSITLTVSNAERAAYFLSSDQVIDFEQLCREIALIAVAAAALAWFVYERITMLPRRKISMTRVTAVIMALIGGYLILGLISTITSPQQFVVWLGNYQLYEGYLALVSYAVIFAAAWYWIDREEVKNFVRNALTILSIVIGALVILESTGICYYNNPIVQALGGLNGRVSFEHATLTFGNPDYLGMYAAMLLPVVTSLIFQAKTKKHRIIQIIAALLIATTLFLTQVANAILIGFGMTLLFLWAWLIRSKHGRAMKILISGVAVIAIMAGGSCFIMTRSGTTISEKLHHTLIGIGQEQTFQLLEASINENTVTLENADTVLTVTAEDTTLSPETLSFVCNGDVITPDTSDNLLVFSEPELEHCQVEIQNDRLVFYLGYAKPFEAIRISDGWQAVGIGGTILDQIPKVSDSRWLQEKYTYLNGRVFVWANTISVLDDCWLIGHGPATSLFYLNQNDLPALLNIFSTYALYNKPHSWYLQMAQDTGILSSVLIIGMLVTFAVCGARKCFGKRTTWNAWNTGLWFSIIAYCLTGIMGDSLIYHAPMFWFLLGIGTRELVSTQTRNAVSK